jgi:hypothetical protein
MKARVVYESIFGNTKEVAEAIGQGLARRYEVELVEVGSAGDTADGVDLLVVGGPTHMLSMTRPTTRRMGREMAAKQNIAPVSRGDGVREWLGGLRQSRGGMAAAFDTAVGRMGIFGGGSAAKGEAARLERKGFRLAARPEQFIIESEGDRQFLKAGELERARKWGETLADRATG